MGKKILILTDSYPPENLGGAEVVASNIANRLALRGEDVLVLTTTKERDKEGDFMLGKVRVKRIYSNYNERWRAYLSLYNPMVVKKIRRIVEEFGPDVVNVHNIHIDLSYYSLKLVKQSGAKVFLTIHDAMSFTYGKIKTKNYIII